jgi:hypothetical protein
VPACAAKSAGILGIGHLPLLVRPPASATPSRTATISKQSTVIVGDMHGE